jgi:hypothetical protein
MTAGRAVGGYHPEQRMRLARFRRRHPGIDVRPAEFSDGWDAVIPLADDGERFLHRADLGLLLDDTETICAGGEARARPD